MRITEQQFNQLVDKSIGYGPWGDCWKWKGKLEPSGYGVKIARNTRPHQAAYRFAGRSVPAGYELNHICNVRECVNPDHLEPITFIGNLAYREMIRRFGYVPRPEELAQAVEKQAIIEQRLSRLKVRFWQKPQDVVV